MEPSSSIPELIKFIKHSFRECEFDEVQNTLMEREKSMKVEMEKLLRDCDELKKQVDFLERSMGYSELEKCDLEEKLRESQKRGEELDKMLVQTKGEFEKLRSEKHDVENELVRSTGKCEEMGKEIEELRRESLSANKTIEELKAKEIEADRVAQELKRQNNEAAAATDAELEKNLQNGEVNPEEDRATESPECPAISGSHTSVMQSGGEAPAEKTVASSSAAGKVAIVICDSDSDDETRIPDTSSGQTKRRKISTSATPSRCRSLPSSRVEERAGALQKSRTIDRIDSTDSDYSISAGYTNNLTATIESKGNNKKGTSASPPPHCPLLSPRCSLPPSRCTTPVVEGAPIFVRPTTINVSSDIGTYYKIKYLSMVKKILREKGGQTLLDRFVGGCFGYLLDWNPGSKCGMALHHVVSRQIKSNGNGLIFFLNNTRVHFSERDYALVTGLRFGEFNFDMSRNHDIGSVEVYRKFCCGHSHVRVSVLVDLFDNLKINDSDGSLYLRVAYIIVLYGMFVGYETDKTVENWVWALVDDLDVFNRFPWGAYTYKLLCQYTSNCPSKNKYKLYGPVWALHVWSLEIIPELGTLAGNCVDVGAHPRCLRWKFRSRPSMKDLRPLFQKEDQPILELVPDEVELTTAYYLSVTGIHVEPEFEQEQDFASRSLHDMHVEEHEVPLHDIPILAHETPTRGMDTRARTSSSHEEGFHRRDKGERVRPPIGSLSSSSDDQVERRRESRDRDYMEALVRRMDEAQEEIMRRMDEAQEERMKRHIDDLEARIKRSLNGFFEDLKGLFNCRSVHPRDVYSPARRPTSAPEARECDDVPDEGATGAEVSHHDNVTQSSVDPHSNFQFGSTSFLGTNDELPRFSNPSDQIQACLDFVGEETGSFAEPSQQIEMPIVPRRSTRQRFPSQQ